MNAVLYARFSPRPDASEADSADLQIARLRRWVGDLERGYTVVGEYRDEGLSGSLGRDRRPGLDAAIEMAIKHKAILCVLKLDRLARSTRHAIDIVDALQKGGAGLASVKEHLDTSNAVGKLVFQMLAAFAEFERAVIVERTTDAMRDKQASGKIMGSIVPYGFKRNPDDVDFCTPNAYEQEVIADIVSMHTDGMSMRAIGRELDKRGDTCRGKRWRHQTIKRILERKQEHGR